MPEPVAFSDHVLEELFEKLASTWMCRESLLWSPDVSLRQLADVEESADALLDGLRLSGPAGVALARPWLRADRRDAAVAAVFVLTASADPALAAELLEPLESGEAAVKEGIGIGLRHSEIASLEDGLRRVATDADPVARSVAADVLAFHRAPPVRRLAELFYADDPMVRARAYASASRFGGPWSPDELQAGLEQPDATIRWAAIHASARLGLPGLRSALRRTASRADLPYPEAVMFLGVLGAPDDLDLLRQLALSTSPLSHAALSALGASGLVAAIPVLIEAIGDTDKSNIAMDAFHRITGASAAEVYGTIRPPGNEGAPVSPPDPEKAAAWWNREKERFPSFVRWQHGLDVSHDPLGPVSDKLPLSIRYDNFLRVCAESAVRIPLEIESRVRLQRRQGQKHA